MHHVWHTPRVCGLRRRLPRDAYHQQPHPAPGMHMGGRDTEARSQVRAARPCFLTPYEPVVRSTGSLHGARTAQADDLKLRLKATRRSSSEGSRYPKPRLPNHGDSRSITHPPCKELKPQEQAMATARPYPRPHASAPIGMGAGWLIATPPERPAYSGETSQTNE